MSMMLSGAEGWSGAAAVRACCRDCLRLLLAIGCCAVVHNLLMWLLLLLLL